MVETFYVHLEFTGKNGKASWSINLPFLCVKCGVCCTLENFLTAGKINDPKNTCPEAHSKFKALTEELGKLFEQDETKYDQHIINNPCPYLQNNACTIYEIRPDGCRLYPHTKFGMDSLDCEPLTRFKKQKSTLKKGRHCKEIYCRTGTGQSGHAEPIKSAKHTEKQYKACIAKLHQVSVTDDELTLFLCLNGCR